MNSAEQLSQYEPEKEKDFNLADTVEYSALDYKKFRRELILDIKKANGFGPHTPKRINLLSDIIIEVVTLLI